MREITHSIYYDEPAGFLARIPGDACHSFLGRRGLEARIFAGRARFQDTDSLEEQLEVIVQAESLLRGNGPSINPMISMNPP